MPKELLKWLDWLRLVMLKKRCPAKAINQVSAIMRRTMKESLYGN